MGTSIHDDLLAPEMIADPYPHLAHLRETDPVHWNCRLCSTLGGLLSFQKAAKALRSCFKSYCGSSRLNIRRVMAK